MLKVNSNTLATSCEESTHWKRTWCWGRLKAGGEGDDRGWDRWMASPTQWTWVWVNSRSWWWTGKPGVLQSMGSQIVGHDWVTELNWIFGPTMLYSRIIMGKGDTSYLYIGIPRSQASDHCSATKHQKDNNCTKFSTRLRSLILRTNTIMFTSQSLSLDSITACVIQFYSFKYFVCVYVQLLSHVWLFVTPRTIGPNSGWLHGL